MTDNLTALDATFLELEQLDEGALMSIGGVAVFDPLPEGGAPTVDRVCADLRERLDQVPRYSQRLSSARTGGFAWPHWSADERFDIRAHVGRVALPEPGGDAELCEWAADFYSHRLDRTRPLWEMALIEGLEQGRWALAHKTHHCLVDGVGSVDVGYLLLDAEATPGARPSAVRPSHDSGSVLNTLLPTPPQPIVQAAQAGAHAVQAGISAALHPREAFARSRSLAELIVRDEVIGAPPHLAESSDRVDSAIRGRPGPAVRVEVDPPRARWIGQRRGARRVRVGPATPAAGARRGAATARTARDGADEPASGLRALGARQPDQLAVR